MSKLFVTVGLPRSGKTTLCRELLEQGFAIVNPDSFRLAIHGQRFVTSAEPFVWAAVYAAVDALLLAGCKVVVDGTHVTEKRRQPWRERGAEFILVPTSKEECIRRARLTNDEYIIPIIEKMAAEWEPLPEKETE